MNIELEGLKMLFIVAQSQALASIYFERVRKIKRNSQGSRYSNLEKIPWSSTYVAELLTTWPHILQLCFHVAEGNSGTRRRRNRSVSFQKLSFPSFISRQELNLHLPR